MVGESHSGVAEGKLRQQRAKGRLWREDEQLPVFCCLRNASCTLPRVGGGGGLTGHLPLGKRCFRKQRSMEEVANLR